MKFDGIVQVLEKKQLVEDVFQLVLKREEAMGEIKTGQFFNLACGESGFPMLRRPISVSYFNEEVIELTIKVLGSGTKQLNSLKSGDQVKIMGPLGNGFDLSGLKENQKVLLIGGGIGVAPLKGLLEVDLQEHAEVHTLLGFKDHPYLINDFQRKSDQLTVVTECESEFERGYVTGHLEKYISENHYNHVFVCGPHAMIKAVASICLDKEINAQLLMEEKMACGVGACLVCTCKVKDDEAAFKHVRMCKEGPMFYASEVIFDV